MNLLAGSTGFLGNEILKVIGVQGIPTLALSRRPIVNLPSCADELIIDFNAISELEIQNINPVSYTHLRAHETEENLV